MSPFEATKKRYNNLEKTVPCLNYNQAQISGTREGFFSYETICHKTRKQTKSWECALIIMRQYYKHHWKTVLINNSLINCAGTNSSNFTMIFSLIAQNRIHFKTRKNPSFSGFLSSATGNPGFKILPWIGNTNNHKKAVIKTLLSRAKRLTSNETNYQEEMDCIQLAFKNNGYPLALTTQSQNLTNTKKIVKNPSLVVLPYYCGLSEKLQRCLRDHKIESFFNRCEQLATTKWERSCPPF